MPAVPYWRKQPDYWARESYKDPKSGELRFNSCMNPKLPVAEVCSGRGSCLPFAQSGLSFCKCRSGFGGAECELRRLSQTKAWVLCLFLGAFGADQYYLGWYLEMFTTQILSVLGLVLLRVMPYSKLPGLALLLGPWLRHVVILGSAPGQAQTDRTEQDLPRCAFVAFSLLWIAFIALALCIIDLKYQTQATATALDNLGHSDGRRRSSNRRRSGDGKGGKDDGGEDDDGEVDGFALDVSPAFFDIRDDHARVHSTSLRIDNPSGAAGVAEISLQHPTARRLASEGLVVLKGRAEAVTQRRLQENCSQPLLLLRPRSHQSVHATRRLAELPGLENGHVVFLPHLGLGIAKLDCTKDAADVAKQLETQHPGDLEFVEVDARSFFKFNGSNATAAPGDSSWSRQWGMRRSGFEAAWAKLEQMEMEPKAVTVAVLDTGVQLNHEDLQHRLWVNPGEIPNNGVDDDGNGYVDDVHGWDFADDDNDPSDEDGHGTHCAGVIGANQNDRGVAGAAGGNSEVRIMALRFLSSDGGRTSD
ncbi:unnamed protein product, partial [Effrenium voratum]